MGVCESFCLYTIYKNYIHIFLGAYSLHTFSANWSSWHNTVNYTNLRSRPSVFHKTSISWITCRVSISCRRSKENDITVSLFFPSLICKSTKLGGGHNFVSVPSPFLKIMPSWSYLFLYISHRGFILESMNLHLSALKQKRLASRNGTCTQMVAKQALFSLSGNCFTWLVCNAPDPLVGLLN